LNFKRFLLLTACILPSFAHSVSPVATTSTTVNSALDSDPCENGKCTTELMTLKKEWQAQFIGPQKWQAVTSFVAKKGIPFPLWSRSEAPSLITWDGLCSLSFEEKEKKDPIFEAEIFTNDIEATSRKNPMVLIDSGELLPTKDNERSHSIYIPRNERPLYCDNESCTYLWETRGEYYSLKITHPGKIIISNTQPANFEQASQTDSSECPTVDLKSTCYNVWNTTKKIFQKLAIKRVCSK